MNLAKPISRRLNLRSIVVSFVTALALSLGACVYDPIYYGPPRHADFYPDAYDYYFYPSVGVYFHFTTGLYFYLLDGVWVSSPVLPPHIIIDARNRVRVRVEADKPYVKFPEHSRLYTPKITPDPDSSSREKDANMRWFEEYKKKSAVKKKPSGGMGRPGRP